MDTDDTTDTHKVRISLVSLDPSYEVPSDDMAVPASIRTSGLNKLVNYLISGESEDENEDDEESGESSSTVFDFMINNRFLRTTLSGYIRANNISAEALVTVHFLPKLTKPDEEKNETEVLPDWVAALAFTNVNALPTLFSACYDGSVRMHNTSDLSVTAALPAHTGPIKTLAAHPSASYVATGGHDQSVQIHSYSAKELSSIASTERHTNSVTALAFRPGQDLVLATGDFDGTLSLFKVNVDGSTAPTTTSNGSKKRKNADVATVSAKFEINLHPSAISALAFSSVSSNMLFTASHDYSVRTFDVERSDPVSTLNGSRVVSCMAKAHHTDVLATGHPDSHIKLWDVRESGPAVSLTTADSPLRPSHKEYISGIAWDLVRPNNLSTCR